MESSVKSPYYITTPIYYVNAKPHMGTAYTSFAADTMARFMRLDNYDVFFLTGTDEHGQKVEQSAIQHQQSPQAYCDHMSQFFRDMNQAFDFTPTQFIRTTDAHHKESVQAFWKLLESKGQIYKGVYSGWYSVRDETFYQQDELVNGKAPTGADVSFIEEESYFFRLSQWQQPLLDWLARHPDAIGPATRRNEVISFIKSGLRDLSISRSSFKWGVPVPGDDQHIMYVWVEALPNYITALGYPDQNDERFTRYWSHATHLVGKDILRFHAVYWPALLMAAELALPYRIFAHGWWTNEGEKMSKSLGNTIDPFKLVQDYGVDQVRYFLLREIAFGQDGNFSMRAFKQRLNADLSNDLGNLVQRVLSFIYKNCDGKICARPQLLPGDHDLLDLTTDALNVARSHMHRQEINKMIEAIWKVIAAANRYVDTQAPWALRKTDTGRMDTVLYVLSDFIRRVAILIQPILPRTAVHIFSILGMPESEYTFKDLTVVIQPGQQINQPTALFPRIDDSNINDGTI